MGTEVIIRKDIGYLRKDYNLIHYLKNSDIQVYDDTYFLTKKLDILKLILWMIKNKRNDYNGLSYLPLIFPLFIAIFNRDGIEIVISY